MDNNKLYKELLEDQNRLDQLIDHNVSDELISKKVGQSCEKNGIYDCELDEDKIFTISIYVECAGHGEVEYNENGQYQDDDGESYDTNESRGTVTLYLSPDNADWEFEVA